MGELSKPNGELERASATGSVSDNSVSKPNLLAERIANIFPPISPLTRITRELLAIALWLSAFIKLCIIDFDSLFIHKFLPEYSWIIGWRFIAIVGALSVFTFFWRLHFLWRWVLYIAFYPAIVLFWKFPILIVKQKSWTLAIASMSLALSAVRDFKYNTLFICGVLISTTICLAATNAYVLYFGEFIAALCLISLFWKTLNAAFFPILSVFSESSLNRIWEVLRKMVNTEILSVPVDEMSDEQRGTFKSNLQLIVLYNRLCHFLASRLIEIKKSNLTTIAYAVRLLIVFSSTVWTFYLLNYSLMRADSANYSVVGHPSGFDVFYYSFNSLFFNSVSGIEPHSVLAKVFSMAGTASMAIFVLVIVVFAVTSAQKARDDGEMELAVNTIQNHVDQIEPFLGEHYGVDIVQAISTLHNMKSELIELIYLLSPSIPRPENNK